MSLHSEFVRILREEGADSEQGWHSWRCFDKGRYPEPCQCDEYVADELVKAAVKNAVEAVKAAVADGDPDSVADFYRCCGCSTYDAIYRDAVAAIEALGGKQ